MKPKSIGIALAALGIAMTAISAAVKIYIDTVTRCIGCSYMPYLIIWLFSGLIVSVGVLLMRSGELEQDIAESKLRINKEFEEAKRKERERDGFQEFIRDFVGEEKQVIELLHTYEGITLGDLATRSGLPEEKLQRTMKSLERKEIAKILESGKIYLTRMSRPS
jgi:uncharacterized membrane protein